MKNTLVVIAILFAYSGSYASESEVSAFFVNAINNSMTFKANTVRDDIGRAMVHYTAAGRLSLINELERTGIAQQAAEKNGSLTTSARREEMQVRQTGSDGTRTSYEVMTKLGLQWFKCINVTCVPAGETKLARVTGTVVSVQENDRPAYKVHSIILDGGVK